MVESEFREYMWKMYKRRYTFIELFHTGTKKLLSKRRSYFVSEWINAGTVELTRARWDWLGKQRVPGRDVGVLQGGWGDIINN